MATECWAMAMTEVGRMRVEEWHRVRAHALYELCPDLCEKPVDWAGGCLL